MTRLSIHYVMNSPNLSTKNGNFFLIKMEIFLVYGMYVQTKVLSMKGAYALGVRSRVVIRGERHGITGD